MLSLDRSEYRPLEELCSIEYSGCDYEAATPMCKFHTGQPLLRPDWKGDLTQLGGRRQEPQLSRIAPSATPTAYIHGMGKLEGILARQIAEFGIEQERELSAVPLAGYLVAGVAVYADHFLVQPREP